MTINRWCRISSINSMTIRHKESARIHMMKATTGHFISQVILIPAIKTWSKVGNAGLKCHVFVIRQKKQWPRKCLKLQGGWFLCSWIRNCMMQRGVVGGMCYCECHRNDRWHKSRLFVLCMETFRRLDPEVVKQKLSSCPYIILSYSYSPKMNTLPVVKRLNWGAKGCTRPKSERNTWANSAMKVCKGSCTTFGCSLFISCSHHFSQPLRHWHKKLWSRAWLHWMPSLVPGWFEMTCDEPPCLMGVPLERVHSPWLVVLYSGLYHLFIWDFNQSI